MAEDGDEMIVRVRGPWQVRFPLLTLSSCGLEGRVLTLVRPIAP